MNDNQYGYGPDQRGPYSTPDQRPFGQVPPEHFRQGGPVRELPKPKRPRRVGKVLLTIFLAPFAVVAGIGIVLALFSIPRAQQAADSAPHVQPTPSQPGAPVPSSTTKPGAKKVAPPTTPRDGVLFVGKDVKPGTYRTTVPADSIACYAARLKDTDGGIDSIISNNLYEPGAQAVLTVKRTDYAIEVRCDGARWELVK